jgi:hypothetical protein
MQHNNPTTGRAHVAHWSDEQDVMAHIEDSIRSGDFEMGDKKKTEEKKVLTPEERHAIVYSYHKMSPNGGFISWIVPMGALPHSEEDLAMLALIEACEKTSDDFDANL